LKVSTEPLLGLEHVSKSFGGVNAVRDVSFSVKSGTVHGLIGPNGAGKTTCFNIVAGVTPADQGRVEYNGKDVTPWPTSRRSSAGIARTFQNIKLLNDFSVFDNLYATAISQSGTAYLSSFFRTRAARRQETEAQSATLAVIERLGLGRYRDALAGDLPIGIQRRVEIARCLLTQPRLLLLDEPVAGMTSDESAEITALIREMKSDAVTVLLVEHDMNVVMEACDMITVLDQGAVIAEGTPSSIRSDDRVLTAYLGADL
jgi:branched-chain amino acid transport system ATP-binding protein